MILRAYTLYDVKALQYHSPYFTHTDGMAVRMLTDLVNEGGNNVSRHPRDFTLYQCGHYDDQTGIFTPLEPLQFVADAVSLVREPAPALFSKPDAETYVPTTKAAE